MSKFTETLTGKGTRRFKKLLKIANSSVRINEQMNYDKAWVIATLEIFERQMTHMNSLVDLRNLNENNVMPGSALINEITTLTGSSDIKIHKNQKLLRVLLTSYLQVYSGTLQILQFNNIDLLYLFNGRFLHERAVWDAAKSINVDSLLYETTRDRYFIRSEGYHDRIKNQEVMISHWNNSVDSLSKKLEVGAKYFAELRGKSNPFRVHTPARFQFNKPFFVYFSNSDDEVLGFYEHWGQKLGEQLFCVKRLQEIFDSQDEYELIIRLHPNLKNKSLDQKRGWDSIKETRSTRIIQPEQQFSSYDLLDKCLGSISFGSTLGLESAFSLKPSLLLADSGYDSLGVVDKANTWDEVRIWLSEGYKISKTELVQRKHNACIRGYYLATGGINFVFSNLVEIGWGAWEAISFKGQVIAEKPILVTYRKIISKWKFRKINKLIKV